MDEFLIRELHKTNYKIFAAIAGGGQSFLGEFYGVAGGSNTIIGAEIPTCKPAFDLFIKNAKIDSYVSEEAARKLAVMAFNKAVLFGYDNCIGLGVSCALSKDSPEERKDRKHSIFISIHSCQRTEVFRLSLKQGRSRKLEEAITKKFIFDALFCFIFDKKTFAVKEYIYGSDGENISHSISFASKELISLMANQVKFIALSRSIKEKANVIPLLCGSFNPIHQGHLMMLDISEKVLGEKPFCELSVINCDKGQLDFLDISQRTSLTFNKADYILTKASTFVEKARLFHEAFPTKEIIFTVGADTWYRVWEEKYAGPVEKVAQVFRETNTKFLVFGRQGSLINLGIGEEFRIKSEQAENFNDPISSSKIRIANKS